VTAPDTVGAALVKALTPDQYPAYEQRIADREHAEAEAAIKRAVGPDWQAGRHEPRDPEAEITTPSLDEMAKAPGAMQTKFRVTYERVGRHGGRDGSKPPAPLTVWALDAEGLAEHIYRDTRPYMLSRDYEVIVDLEKLRGFIFTGNNGGSFAIEVVQVAEAGEDA
jgi:hypothetical protein